MDAATPAAALALWLHQFPWAEPALVTLHLLSITCVVGCVAAFDVRLLGAVASQSARGFSRLLISFALVALLPAVGSGVALAALNATVLITSPAFFWKIIVLFALAINAMIFVTGPYQRVSAWDVGPPPWAARLCGAISLLLLLAVVVLGADVAWQLAHAH